MVMATLHGTQLTIKMSDGHEETFELVRVGTIKEFETVKEALDNATDGLALTRASLDTAKGQRVAMSERMEAANGAYVAEKETGVALAADLNTQLTAANEERGRLNGLLESARADFDELKSAYLVLRDDHDARVAELSTARIEKDGLATSCDNFKRALLEARAELDNLMTVKASLEETNTALEVSQKELCEATEALADATKANAGFREANSALTHDCDISKFALARLKAELRDPFAQMKTILDTMAEKISGE